MIVGLLPASGSASRLHGIPKFLLPLEGHGTLLNWHLKLMLEICDEIRICTRAMWMPFLMEMNLPPKVKFYVIEPSTLNDALVQMMYGDHRFIFGMPDTYIANSDENIYKRLSESDSSVTLAAFDHKGYLKGVVGQIKLDDQNNVIDLQEKTPTCAYDHMWGAMAFNNVELTPTAPFPSIDVMNWIKESKDIKAIKLKGNYIDVGTFDGLKRLYT